MQNVLLISQIVAGFLLTIAILLQVRGKGFGRLFAAGTSFTRRGLEKVVFKLTFVFAFLFIVISILQVIV